MIRPFNAALVLLLTFAVSGCSGGAADNSASPRSTGVVVADAEGGSDLGNGRPRVTYDGLMVRRRVVIAVHATSSAVLAALRNQLHLAAAHRHTTLSTMSASVLDPALLEQLAPDLVVALPAGTTPATAATLIDTVSPEGRRITDDTRDYDVVPALVHDLRFTVTAAKPAALSRAITREGILADALGHYTTTLHARELDIAYTGPLLSDHLVESVRNGIARPAGLAPKAVTVSPRSTTGTGVDMEREPAPGPAVIDAQPGHQHSAGDDHSTGGDAIAATPDGTSTSHANPWAELTPAAIVLLLFLATVRLLSMRPIKPPEDNEARPGSAV